jgi:hypothetical protein
MGKTTKYTERKFLGILPENPTKQDIRFHQKHERAYLKGWDRFRFGYEKETLENGTERTLTDANGPIPVWYNVHQEVTENKELKAKLTGRVIIN